MRCLANEIAIDLLMDHINTCYFEPHSKWPAEVIEEHAYERTAAFDILQLLQDNPDDFPSCVVEAYYDKVSYYWAISEEGSRQELRFSIAILVASDVLDNIIPYAV